MAKKHKTEVLVVGAGPVGMFTALSLARQGNQVEIIDGQWRTTSRSYALALHPASLRLLDEMGLAARLIEKGYRVDTVAFFDGGERTGEVAYAELQTDFPFVLVLPQRVLEETLEEALASHDVSIRWSHRLAHFDGDGRRVQVERLAKESMGYSVMMMGWVVDKVFDYETRFLVGTDGIHSTVRRCLGIDYDRLSDPQEFGVFEFGADGGGHEMRVVLADETTNVLWPLAEDRFRWSFELGDSLEDEVPAQRTKSRLAVQVGSHTFPHLDQGKLAQLIEERAPWFDAAIGEVSWSVAVRFELRLAESFGRDAGWLAGDAAHVASPVGVQSMNVGLREGYDLSQRLTAILRQGESTELLDAYDDRQKRQWRRLFGLAGDLKARRASGWTEKRAARIPMVLPASGDDLKALLSQLGIEM